MNNEENKNFTAAAPRAETLTDNTAAVIPVIEEQITVDKQVVESGKVRISKHVREVEELVDIPLLHEEVSVERVLVNRVVEERLPVRYDGDMLIIPVVEEQVVVQKRLVLIEELHVRKQTIETHQPQRVTLLKEEVEITRSTGGENSGG
ncbi:MAG TPA: YsnF/AvaK domain-containing protein [Pyrinomonadaceae bacterium]|nr:YsnF/AvaK domain-containing protein [Pyrinomonadaceae bacterium]